MQQALREKSIRDLLRMQKNLNATFVHKRDKGQNIQGIYKYLRAVEDELSRRKVYWDFPRRRAQRP